MGLGEKLFVPGDQFIAILTTTPLFGILLALTTTSPTDPRFQYSITFSHRTCLMERSIQQLFRHFTMAEAELPAGEHIFTIDNLKYKFTTGGQIVPSWRDSVYCYLGGRNL